MARIFFLTPRFPHPLDKGDKLRAYHQIRVLSRHHRVTLCALSHQPVAKASREALAPFCERIEVLSQSRVAAWGRAATAPLAGLPFQVGYFSSRSARQRVRQLIGEARPDHVYCQLARTAEYAAGIGVPTTVDLMDAFSRGLAQRVQRSALLARPLMQLEQRLLRSYERSLVDRFQHVTIISAHDRAAIDHPARDTIHLVPNGVDLDLFHPREAPVEAELLFVGNMAYPPNVLATQILVRRIMPLVWAHRPGCRLLIAGTNPTRSVRNLQSDRVRVSGWVDDITNCYARSAIFVAPMVTATGVQNKLLQALAMGRPCVTTALANQALGAGVDEVVIAESPADFAAAITGLLDDPVRAAEIGRRGRLRAEHWFRWEDSVAPLDELFNGAASGEGPTAEAAAR